MSAFSRLAIVNRGEPAMRLLRAVTDYNSEHGTGITTIALYTEPDAAAWFVREADEAVNLGPATVADPTGKTKHTYLDRDRLMEALASADADAVWVGWGFVAEDPAFAERCEQAGITFIGPSSAVIRRLGDKIAAKRIAEQADVPVTPWSGGPVTTAGEAAKQATDVGYPLLIKAAAGGGGRGIRRVDRAEELPGQLSAAQSEAELAFGDATVFLESMVQAAHHVEVQVIADTHGTVWAAGVRDCSLQRRNQKVLEESASVSVPAPTRAAMKAAAVRLCSEAGYHNAGTVEFLYDPATDSFYFMEVNTRLQVEHPVTELTTGLDLVKLQMHVARGGRLEGEAPPEVGHAVEFRLNAEDPERGFVPTPGRVAHFRIPAGPGVRVDTGVADGDVIAPEFDPMIAKVLTYGHDRTEALARMRRALREAVVVVQGGMTNKSFLLTLLDRPEVLAAEVDTGWLDRLTARGEHIAAHHGACLLAAAVEAYEVDHATARAQFLATAARGRPVVAADAGRRIDLRFRGRSYSITVHALGDGRYRLATEGGTFDVERERLGIYERSIALGGQRMRVVADIQGPTYQIEVDGIPHRIERDDGGFVRSPAPAVVISFAVAPGDEVAAGTPIAVIESMKMETTVAAPFAGRVRRLLVATNAQVDAGAPLLQLEPIEGKVGGDSTGPEAVDFALVSSSRAVPASPAGRRRAQLEALRSHLLGFDLDEATLRMLLSELPASAISVAVDDADVLALEREILDIYADLGGLSRRSPSGDEEDAATGASPREYLLTYLRSIDRGPEILPATFVRRLEQALRRYGITSLDRAPELEDALLWMYRSFVRLPGLTPAIAGILDRWLAGADPLRPVLGGTVRSLLDRVIDAAEGRAQTVSDLAREVRYRFVDEPVLQGARATEYAEMDAVLDAIAADPGRDDRGPLVDRMVASPLPMRPLLLAHAFSSDLPAMRETALEVRIRRYYRIRELRNLRFTHTDDVTLCLADYATDGMDVLLACAYTRWTDLDRLLAIMADAVQSADADHEVVLDLTVTRDTDPVDIDTLNAEVAQRVAAAGFEQPLHRVDLSVTFSGGGPEHQRTLNVTYRQHDGALVEQELYRNLHPMLAKRIGLWRLGNFHIRRLSSAEDVYLMLATAKDNPADQRLFAIAEVRDLTPLLGDHDEIVALPLLERIVMESFSAMRRHLSRLDPRKRPLHNRLVLYVRPPWRVPPRAWRSLAHRLAPASVGLGLEKVVLRVRVPDADDALTDEVLHVENLGQRGVVVRREPPSDDLIRTLSPYQQRVLKTEQRGGVYPYELLRRLTPSADSAADFPVGEFTEYDLDDDGALVPVEREPGQNTANLVVGLISNRTDKVPEGMERGIILGDPSRSLGSLAEAECRRIMGIIDLAEERGIPVEWFAVSSGARISMESGTENMDWIAAVLRRLIEFTQVGGEVNVVVTGINVGAQPYWNAEATMLLHTRGVLIMTPASAMVLTGKQALDFSGGVSAEDNFGIGGFDRIMGPNGQGQYWAPNLEAACELLFDHYAHTYRVPGERFPRRARTSDSRERDVRSAPHQQSDGSDFRHVGDIFSAERNPERKKPFDMRSLMRAVADDDAQPLERWQRWRDAETVITWDAHLGGIPVAMIGIESHPVQRYGFAPADGPTAWTSGTLFPQSSRKCARALNAASGNRPAVVLANLSGFDGSPESMREWQLEYGAEIGRAVTNFDGPIVFCVVSRYHGGAFVVFSKPLNEGLEIAAVEGSYASVIGGTPAAAVVFARDVRRRTDNDPRVTGVREQIEGAAAGQAAALRAELERVRAEVHAEMIGVVADEFDSVHSIERAQRVGSVDRIIAAADLRPYLIDAVERGMDRVKG